jgi:hypothetical protein
MQLLSPLKQLSAIRRCANGTNCAIAFAIGLVGYHFHPIVGFPFLATGAGLLAGAIGLALRRHRMSAFTELNGPRPDARDAPQWSGRLALPACSPKSSRTPTAVDRVPPRTLKKD